MNTVELEDTTRKQLESLGRFGDTHEMVVARILQIVYSEPKLVDRVRNGDPPSLVAGPHATFDMGPGNLEKTLNRLRTEAAGVSNEKERLRALRAKKGTLTPHTNYVPWMMKIVLHSPEHAMRAGDVLEQLEARVRELQNPIYFTELPSSNILRWRTKAELARKFLKERGLLETATVAGHGIWMLSAAGVEAAKKVK